MTLPCAECKKTVNLRTVKYYTADKQNVFCDAYCSVKFHQRIKEQNERTVDREV